MFIQSRKIVGILVKDSTIMSSREVLKIELARNEWKKYKRNITY